MTMDSRRHTGLGLRYSLGPGVVAALLGSFVPLEAQSEPRRCKGPSDGVRLEHVDTQETGAVVPRTVSVRQGHSYSLVGNRIQIQPIGLQAETNPVALPSDEVDAIWSDGSALLVAYADRVLIANEAGTRVRQIPRTWLGRIHSVVSSAGQIWLASRDGDGTRVAAYSAQAPDSLTEHRSWRIESGWRLAAHPEGLFLIEVARPYRVALLTPQEPAPTVYMPLQVHIPSEVQKVPVYATALVPLGCGDYLANFSDIASTDRWLLKLTWKSHSFGLQVEPNGIQEGLPGAGFFQSDLRQGEVYALSVGQHGTRILTFRIN